MALKDEFMARYGEGMPRIPSTRPSVFVPPDAVQAGEVASRPYEPGTVDLGERPRVSSVFDALPMNARKVYVPQQTILGAYAGAVQIVSYSVPVGFAGVLRAVTVRNSENVAPFFTMPAGDLEVTAASAPNMAGSKLTCLANGSAIEGMIDVPFAVNATVPLYGVVNEDTSVQILHDVLSVADTGVMTNRTILATLEIDLIPIVEGDYRSSVVRG